MREISENDPQYILALCNAANDLVGAAGGVCWRDNDSFQNIALLRAGAFGWREAQTQFQLPYANRKPPDARHDAATCGKYAKEADHKADKLCKQVGVPFEMQGHHEGLAQSFWKSYSAVYVEVGSFRVSWLLITLAGANRALKKFSGGPGFVEHGGTDEARARADRDLALEKLSEATTDDGERPHYERDEELIYLARQAWAWMSSMVASYNASRLKAMQN